MKVLATLLLLLQLGPFAGAVLCHAQPMCGMPQQPTAVTAPGGSHAGMDHRDCSALQVCSPAVVAVLPAVVRVEPSPCQHPFILPQGRSLLAGIRAAPLPPPPRA
jgi:hypothetical protein